MQAAEAAVLENKIGRTPVKFIKTVISYQEFPSTGEIPLMQKFVFTAALIFGLSALVHSQSPATTPTPKADEDVVKITTHLIQVDVTVTDKSGKVVHDLKPEDFEIYENGQKQKISNFSFVSSVRENTTEERTTDKRQLYAAIDHIRWNPLGTGNVSAFGPMEAKIDPGPTPNTGKTIEDLKKDQDQFRASVFATGTLGAVN